MQAPGIQNYTYDEYLVLEGSSNKTLTSLRQYVLVSHTDRSLRVWTRTADAAWQSTTYGDGDVAELSIGARVDVRKLYDAAAEPA